MSDDGSLSLQEAIREWLANTVDSASDASQHQSEHSKRPRSGHRHDSNTHKHEDEVQSTARWIAAPARHRRADSPAQDTFDDHHRRKRRRMQGNSESLLESAASENFKDPPRRQSARMNGNEHSSLGKDDSTSSRSDYMTALRPSDTLRPLPNEVFRRRPRHKTRQDRYALKNEVPNRITTRGRTQKPSINGRQSRKKTGARLMQDFEASNVTQDRLTLRPFHGIGLFRNGKCSSPLKRRPLHDLAFSEQKFLNKQRDDPEPHEGPLGQKKRPPDKRKHSSTEEISRYFATNDFTEKGPLRHSGLHHHQTPGSSKSKPSNLEVDYPPFLGFGSHGPNSSSPIKKLQNGNPIYGSNQRHRLPATTPIRSSSYFTWSQSDRSPTKMQQSYQSAHQAHNASLSQPAMTRSEHVIRSPPNDRVSTNIRSRQIDGMIGQQLRQHVHPAHTLRPKADEKSSLNGRNDRDLETAELEDPVRSSHNTQSRVQDAMAGAHQDAKEVDDSESCYLKTTELRPPSAGRLEWSGLRPAHEQALLDDELDALLQANRHPFTHKDDEAHTQQLRISESTRGRQAQKSPSPLIQPPYGHPIQQGLGQSPGLSNSDPVMDPSTPTARDPPQRLLPKHAQSNTEYSVGSWLPDSHLGRHVHPQAPGSRMSSLAESGFDRPFSTSSFDHIHNSGNIYQRQAMEDDHRPLERTQLIAPYLRSPKTPLHGLQASRWHSAGSEFDNENSKFRLNGLYSHIFVPNARFTGDGRNLLARNGQAHSRTSTPARTYNNPYPGRPEEYGDQSLNGDELEGFSEDLVDRFKRPGAYTSNPQYNRDLSRGVTGRLASGREDGADVLGLSRFWPPNKLH